MTKIRVVAIIFLHIFSFLKIVRENEKTSFDLQKSKTIHGFT